MKLILQAIKSLFRKLERNLEKSIQKVQNDIDGTKASIVQSDFAQNDASQLDYVKNRTHWSEGTGEVLYDGTITLNNNTTVQPDKYFTLEAGRSYTVIYNDDVYECKADANTNGVAIGTEDFSDLPIRIITTDMDGRLITYLTTPFSTGSYKLKLIDGVLHKIDPKYLPEAPTTLPNPNALTINGTSYDGSAPVDISIEAGEASSPDWNAAEGETGHILNRTHYEYTGWGVLLETSVTTTESKNYAPINFTLEVGKKYTIELDGVTYNELVAFDDDGACIGEVYDYEADDYMWTEYPFAIYNVSSSKSRIYIQTAGDHTLQIYGDGVAHVHKLDAKYLPDDIVNIDDIKSLVKTIDYYSLSEENKESFMLLLESLGMTPHGIVKESDGNLYYYKYGTKNTEYLGLIKLGEDYYYINTTGQVVHDSNYWISKPNGIMHNAYLQLDSDGKAVWENCLLHIKYMYNGGVLSSDLKTVHKYRPFNLDVKDDKSVIVLMGGIDITTDTYNNGEINISSVTNDISIEIEVGSEFLPSAFTGFPLTFTGAVTETYDGYAAKTVNIPYGFSDTNATEAFIKILLDGTYETEQRYNIHTLAGKMGLKSGIVKESADTWYYYEFGEQVYAGLILIDGDYYYVSSFCKVVHGQDYWISKNNGFTENAKYHFDEYGRMDITLYTISNNLTNVTATVDGNANSKIGANTKMTSTLTADDGYTITSVTITVGGEDITATAYDGVGNISIPAVTGDIVITATAEPTT